MYVCGSQHGAVHDHLQVIRIDQHVGMRMQKIETFWRSFGL